LQGPCRELLTFRRQAFLSAFFQCLDFLHSQRAPGFLGARWPVASEVFFRGVSPKGRLSTAPGFLGAVLRHLTPQTAFFGAYHQLSAFFAPPERSPDFWGALWPSGLSAFFVADLNCGLEARHAGPCGVTGRTARPKRSRAFFGSASAPWACGFFFLAFHRSSPRRSPVFRGAPISTDCGVPHFF
jgi:hypothetical protein